MQTRFKSNAKIFDIVITAVAGMLSIGVMLYGVFHFGLREAWPELVLNMFYIFCLVMIWMYFFNRIDTHRFNYWCSISVGNNGVAARYTLPAAFGRLCTPPVVSRPCCAVALHADLLLCTQEQERTTPSETCGSSVSLTCSLQHSTTMLYFWSPSTNTLTICSQKSGFVQPSRTDSWHVL